VHGVLPELLIFGYTLKRNLSNGNCYGADKRGLVQIGSRLCSEQDPHKNRPSFLSDITDHLRQQRQAMAPYPCSSWFLYPCFAVRWRQITAEYINLEDCVPGKSCFLVPVQSLYQRRRHARTRKRYKIIVVLALTRESVCCIITTEVITHCIIERR